VRQLLSVIKILILAQRGDSKVFFYVLKHSDFANDLIVFMRSASWILKETDRSHMTWYGSLVNTVMNFPALSSHWFLKKVSVAWS